MSFLLCLYFREELVSSRVLFSPLCTGKLFLWKWTGLAGPLIPLCDSISFIKLWHLTCYKGIENSTIWAFQSAGFLLKNRGMYLKATFRSTCLSGLHFNKFLWKNTIYSPRLGENEQWWVYIPANITWNIQNTATTDRKRASLYRGCMWK